MGRPNTGKVPRSQTRNCRRRDIRAVVGAPRERDRVRIGASGSDLITPEARADRLRSVLSGRCTLLVLDDVGVDRLTEWGSGALDRLVNKRHEQMLPTWLTTNLDPSDGGPLKEYLGNRSWSRLMEDAHIVVMNGADRRLR